ncbi:MAG TPA: DUF4190 domain-containing protein [Actinobacteria bacterium]|nr:DUF4190 domain-containing protein [Actinomycetota bacterium]
MGDAAVDGAFQQLTEHGAQAIKEECYGGSNTSAGKNQRHGHRRPGASIVGIFCCGVASVVGLILGIVELGRINRGESSEKGRGFAKAAIIIGAIAVTLGVIVNIILAITGNWSFYITTS